MINYLRNLFLGRARADKCPEIDSAIAGVFKVPADYINSSVSTYGWAKCVSVSVASDITLRDAMTISDAIFFELGIRHDDDVATKTSFAEEFDREMRFIGWGGDAKSMMAYANKTIDRLRSRYGGKGVAIHTIKIGDYLFVAAKFNN